MNNNRITESEIHSLIRKFLKVNNFKLVTKTIDGEPLHYLTELTKRPRYKIPDHVAIKDNFVLILEDKIKHSDLFGNEKADVNKLSKFFYNEKAVKKFLILLQKLEHPINNPQIICGLASLCPQNNCKTIPEEFFFLSIDRNNERFIVSVAQSPKGTSLFEENKIELTL